MSTDDREELASLYVLGLLEGNELAAFEREMVADPTLASLVSDLENAANSIALSAPQTSPPSTVRDRIFQEIETLRKTTEPAPVASHSFAWIPWALAASLAIFAGLTWIEKSKISTTLAEARERNFAILQQNAALTENLAELQTERLRLETRVSALEAEKNQLSLRVTSLESRNPLNEVQALTLAPEPEAPKGSAVTALWDGRRQAGVLDLSKLPAPAADKDYQLWILSPDSPAPISAGVISTATPQASFQSPRPITQVAALAISLEPKGGSESRRGPVIYVGKF